jgi:hypothetical protein
MLTITLVFLLSLTGNQSFSQDIAELEKAFSKDLKRAKQYPKNETRLANLAVSYDAVQGFDEDAISRLRSTGQPDIWYNVYRILQKLDNRQSQVMKLPEASLKVMNFQMKEYGEDILESKNKAAAYFYAHANKLMDTEKPDAARQAYGELVNLAKISGSYKDMDVLLRKAVLYGATKIDYQLYNKTGKVLDERIVNQLSVAIYAYRDTRLKKTGEITVEEALPIELRVYLNEIKVSPDRVKELNYGEERDIFRDGQVVDTIRCDVNQYKQVKGAVLSGRIDIYDVKLKSVINTIPIMAESMFVHSYATLKGNPDAAGEETRKMLAQKKVEFPSNESIVMDAVEEFTKMAIQVILPL